MSCRSTVEPERAIIGSALVAPEVIDWVPDLLADDFHDQAARKVWQAMLDLRHAGEQIDNVTVEARLPTSNGYSPDSWNWRTWLFDSAELISSPAAIVDYARPVLKAATKRKRDRLAEELLSSDDDERVTEIISELATLKATVKLPDTIRAADLMFQQMPQPRFVVSTLIPAGLSIVAGKPKAGKSWWALSGACSVASGAPAFGRLDVDQGPVLYVAAEDTLRRLQSRLKRILEGEDAPYHLHLATGWPRIDKGGISAFASAIKKLNPAWIIADTLQMIRPQATNGNVYDGDYSAMSILKSLADEHGIAITAVTHQRKLPADDPLESITGSMGISGAADAVIVLTKPRKENAGMLFATGRDLAEVEYSLAWDEHRCLWTIEGNGAEYRQQQREAEAERKASEKRRRAEANLEADRQAVVTVLTKLGLGATKSTLKDRCGLNTARLTPALASLLDDGTLAECQVQRPNTRRTDPGLKISE